MIKELINSEEFLNEFEDALFAFKEYYKAECDKFNALSRIKQSDSLSGHKVFKRFIKEVYEK